MILPDVNVLLYAQKKGAPNHGLYLEWLENVLGGDEAYGMSELVLSAAVRILTNPKIYENPTPLPEALSFAAELKNQPHCVLISPGPRHWEIFDRLARQVNAKGALITDVYFAALAIESGSEWITTDLDYSRFPGLHWRHPLKDAN